MATAELKKGDVKDIGLADAGKRKIEWAGNQMPVLNLIRKRFLKEKPLKGLRVSACLHVTSETAKSRRRQRDSPRMLIILELGATKDVPYAPVERGPLSAFKTHCNDARIVIFTVVKGLHSAAARRGLWSAKRFLAA